MDRDLSTGERRVRRLATALPWLLGAAGLVGLLLWGAGALQPELEARDTRTARVRRGDLESVLSASGTVVPGREELVSSPLEARVLRVLRRPGALVAEGDPLLELDVASARLALEKVEGRISEVENEIAQGEATQADALLELAMRRELKALDLEDQRYELERHETLRAEGLVADTQVRQARVRLKKAELELAQLEASLRNKRRAGEAGAGRLAAQLRTLRAERKQALRQLERATTLAPRAGVLTWIVGDEGATVRVGDELARVADLGSFRVDGSVADLHAGRIAEGQPVIVPIGEQRLRGRVGRVLPAIEGGRLRFEAELDEPAHPALRAALRVDVQVVTQRRESVLTIPRGAYLNGSGPQPVFVIEGDRARRREVEIGLAGAEGWEVLSGLAEGDRLVISDISSIRHLTEVRWSEEP